jgi:catechol 2,3-dioxygenase-like lactoylglutathione lyase family enzyme
MRTLHVGLRASDLERSLAFYTALGYTAVGTVEGTKAAGSDALDAFVSVRHNGPTGCAPTSVSPGNEVRDGT